MKSTKVKLSVMTERMLELMEFSIINKHAENQKDWCSKIGFTYSNISQVRSGRQGFTDEQKLAAVHLVGANMNWIYGIESNMIRITKMKGALDLIKEGVRMLEKK